MKAVAAVILLAATPLIVRAITFKEVVNNHIVPFTDVLINLFYALAFLYFMIGLARFFFSSSEEAREKGKKHAFWGIIGLVVLFGVWGFVRVLLSVLGVGGSA